MTTFVQMFKKGLWIFRRNRILMLDSFSKKEKTMKKLIMLACLAGAMCAFSDDPAPKAADAKDKAPVAQRQRPTPEEMKARREKFMADMKARREAMQAKILDALKEAGLDEAKAKETADKKCLWRRVS